MSDLCPVCKKQITDDWKKIVFDKEIFHSECFEKIATSYVYDVNEIEEDD